MGSGGAAGGCLGAAVDAAQLVISAAGAAGNNGGLANIASFARFQFSGSSHSSSAVVAETGTRRHRSLVKEDAEQVGRYQLADRFIFGPVPSREEAAEAVSSIQQMFLPDASSHEPARQLYSANGSQSLARRRVHDAFRLLQINPSVKRTVVSLATDKAVWDAVMKNESVQELRAAFYSGRRSRADEVEGTILSDLSARALNWVFDLSKSKILELVQKIAKIVDELLLPGHRKAEEGHQKGLQEDALRSSFMLSILVSIVIVVARIHKAFPLDVGSI
ncbi:unnamed protein product [Spirodela intermedia]|uniref:Uncharacterized protein n=1 Tax=Spirodela intermedia TaxID=51605 RepID=A0A7I8J9C5_SPIIN|nr:unnamed protein product [Spirodela intermedia]CAA6666777.1 unnamed protein product [Spirodela intermedia]